MAKRKALWLERKPRLRPTINPQQTWTGRFGRGFYGEREFTLTDDRSGQTILTFKLDAPWSAQVKLCLSFLTRLPELVAIARDRLATLELMDGVENLDHPFHQEWLRAKRAMEPERG